jgi:mannitol/fructose-specific phosphotransferase system IIA component (Ntr-type)
MTVLAAPAIADLSRFIPDLRSRRREGALGELVDAAARDGAVRAARALLEIVKLRERFAPAAVVQDAAVQGTRSLSVIRPFVALGRSLRGIEWPGAPADTVHLVVLALAPVEWSEERFHALLARAGGLVRLQRDRQRLITAGSDAVLAAQLREALS